VDVVVPQNLSGALNYACVRCVTQALATQLVVSIPGALTDAQNAQLAAVWKELQAFGAHLQDVPLTELQSRLSEFEQQILGIVVPGGTNGGTPPTSAAVQSGAATSAPATASAGTGGGSSSTAATGTAGSPSDGGGGSSGAGSATSAPAVSASETAAPTTTAPTTAPGTPTG
jgi:putative peptide zinc metalloprotease protein